MSNYKIINNSIYISLKNVAEDFKKVCEDIEMWLNEDFTFIQYWEKIFNDEGFEYNTNSPIVLTEWIDSSSKSLIRDEDEVYIHAHALLGFSLTDPIVKINLINNIYKLPKDILESFLNSTYAINNIK